MSSVEEILSWAARGELRGVYFTYQATGALSNGTRVQKSVFEPGDAHARGAFATVIGSVGPFVHEGAQAYGYFVVWDDAQDVAVFVAGPRIKPALNQ